MTTVFAILAWLFLAKIVFEKQYKACFKAGTYSSDSDKRFTARLFAIFAPLTVIIYAIRAVFFEDWI